MKNVLMFAYSPASEAAANLANEMGINRIKHKGSKFVGGRQHTVINYGSSNLPAHVASAGHIINKPEHCNIAANKLSFFNLITKRNKDVAPLVNIPEYTTDAAVARGWLDNKEIVVCRTQLRANGGDGIVIAKAVGDIVDAPLYVKYIPKLREYRVHVVGGVAIDMQRKVCKPGEAPKCWQVRSHDNGFIFQRGMDGIDQAELNIVKQQATLATLSAKLDFAGVDVIWNEKQKMAYVLEVNTAPGIEEQTVRNYAAALGKLVND